MAIFVLVHGAWGGATSWRQFAPLLREKGHEVFAPSLTGQGERVHLGGPQTNLTTHITDVVNLVEYEDLQEIVLVGHSYGGMVVAGVADRIPDRISHLVFLDAFLPQDGQSCFDLGGAGGPGAIPVEDGWRIGRMRNQPAPELPPERQRFVGHPVGTLEEKVRISVPLDQRAFTRTYVKAAGAASRERRGAFWEAAARVSNDLAWRYIELPTGHGVHREMPLAVAGILLDLVKPEAPVALAL